MDRTNSQPKSSNASVGTNQPIDLPTSNDPRKKHKHHRESSLQQHVIPNQPRDERLPHDESVRRSRRYYDDSDDMVDRVRRVRAAFEKRINGFQGADWPHYVKRTIVGKKRMEPSSAHETFTATGDKAQPKTHVSTLPFPSDTGKDRG